MHVLAYTFQTSKWRWCTTNDQYYLWKNQYVSSFKNTAVWIESGCKDLRDWCLNPKRGSQEEDKRGKKLKHETFPKSCNVLAL